MSLASCRTWRPDCWQIVACRRAASECFACRVMQRALVEPVVYPGCSDDFLGLLRGGAWLHVALRHTGNRTSSTCAHDHAIDLCVSPCHRKPFDWCARPDSRGPHWQVARQRRPTFPLCAFTGCTPRREPPLARCNLPCCINGLRSSRSASTHTKHIDKKVPPHAKYHGETLLPKGNLLTSFSEAPY